MKTINSYTIYDNEENIIRDEILTKKELISYMSFLKKEGTNNFYCMRHVIDNSEYYRVVDSEVVAYVKNGKTVMLNNKPRKYTIIDILNDDDEVYEDDLASIVRYKSKFYNMKKICEFANVNYLSYKGWSCQGRSLSDDKLNMLLKAMRKVAE